MVKWDDKLEVKFLCTVLKCMEVQVPRESWGVIAKKMGPGFTLEACRLHYAKVQKESDSDNAVGAADPASPSAATTPVKRQRKRKEPHDNGAAPEKSPKKSKKTIKQEENGFTTTVEKKEHSTAATDSDGSD